MSHIVETNKHVLFTYNILDAVSSEVLEQMETPIAYIHSGTQRMIEKVEAAMAGASVGDTVETQLSPEEGFGEADPELIITEKLENVPPQFKQLGAEVQFQNDSGDIKTFIVTSISEMELTMDGNSPLVGRHLTFRVTIHAIRDATENEIVSGLPADSAAPGLP